MSAAEIKSGPYQVGRFKVEFSLRGNRLEAAWSPDLPKGQLHLIRKYRAARNHFLKVVQRERGSGPVLVVEY